MTPPNHRTMYACDTMANRRPTADDAVRRSIRDQIQLHANDFRRSGAVFVERRRSGIFRCFIRFRVRSNASDTKNRSITLFRGHRPDLAAYARALLAELRREHDPRYGWSDGARNLWTEVLNRTRPLREARRQAVRTLFRQCGGDFRRMLMTALFVDSFLADRATRPVGGRPRRGDVRPLPDVNATQGPSFLVEKRVSPRNSP